VTTIVAVAVAAVAVSSVGVASAGVKSQQGVTSNEIKVAGITDPNGADAALGAKVRFDQENAKGGVNGRKITLVETANDKDDPATNLSEVRRLVTEDGVAAIVPVQTPYTAGDYLKSAKMPFFGWGVSPAYYKNPYSFGFTGSLVPPNVTFAGDTWGKLIDKLYKGQGDQTGAKGKTAAVISQDNSAGTNGVKVIGAAARAAGMKVVYQKAPIPAAAPPGDYSPYVQALLTSNKGGQPDVIFVVTQFNYTLPLSALLQSSGFKGVLTNAVAYDPRLASSAKGETVFTQFDVPEDTANPNMVKITNALKAGLNGKTLSQAVLAGYLTADQFVAALKKAGKNPSSATIQKAASKLTWSIPGVVGTTKYPTGYTYGTPCGTLVQSDGTAYKIVAPYGCYENVTVPGLKPIPY
jgi:ABC-type branched-subunit amino acid transport system substrate-binding protein